MYSVFDRRTEGVKWTWASRVLHHKKFHLDAVSEAPPAAGDLVLLSVDHLGFHTSLVMADNRKLRIYPGDFVVGVFGNRYATDAYEAEVAGTENLSVLTAGGMVGTVKSKHQRMARPTSVSFVGFLDDDDGRRINLKTASFRPARPRQPAANLVLVIGTAMNSGKTTTSSKLIKGLAARGLRVAACKLTGSVSNRDQDEMRAAGAQCVVDFSDHGFPSTYLCGGDELVDLFATILADVERVTPEVTVMELADGFLQRETAMLLRDPRLRSVVKGIVLTADSATAALFGAAHLAGLGYPVIAASGAFTSAPLFVAEVQAHGDVPVASSADDGGALVARVTAFLGLA